MFKKLESFDRLLSNNITPRDYLGHQSNPQQFNRNFTNGRVHFDNKFPKRTLYQSNIIHRNNSNNTEQPVYQSTNPQFSSSDKMVTIYINLKV